MIGIFAIFWWGVSRAISIKIAFIYWQYFNTSSTFKEANRRFENSQPAAFIIMIYISRNWLRNFCEARNGNEFYKRIQYCVIINLI